MILIWACHLFPAENLTDTLFYTIDYLHWNISVLKGFLYMGGLWLEVPPWHHKDFGP